MKWKEKEEYNNIFNLLIKEINHLKSIHLKKVQI